VVTLLNKGQTNRLLGYPVAARLLILNADNFGMCHAISWIEKVQSQGLPSNDHDFLDSYLLDPVDKSARFVQMLRGLPTGLSEWAVHPGLDNAELLTIEIEPKGKHIRQMDFDFLMSQEAQDIVKEEGIILLDYRGLQVIWGGK
jgi:YdjC-like protein